jgi:hypothetical protein
MPKINSSPVKIVKSAWMESSQNLVSKKFSIVRSAVVKTELNLRVIRYRK